MTISSYDIKEFYATKTGQFVQSTLTHKLEKILPEVSGKEMIGLGFPFPYMNLLEAGMRSFVLSPKMLGPYLWPTGAANKTTLSDFTHLPLVDSTADLVLMVHGLEFMDSPQKTLEEIRAILKPEGRLFLIVPNRGGFWARLDQTPLGQGLPYSLGQLKRLLKDQDFVIERLETALYTPPWRSNLMLNGFAWMEKMGEFLPLFPGVHIVEASKKVVGVTPVLSVERTQPRKKPFSMGTAKPQPS